MKRSIRENGGFTLIELIVSMAIVAIISGTVIYNLKALNNPLGNAAFSIEQFLRLARSRAIANTAVVQVQALTTTRLAAYTSDSCSGEMTAMSDMVLKLPFESALQEVSSSVCFDQRGLADISAIFNIVDSEGDTKTVRVALGGGIKIDS